VSVLLNSSTTVLTLYSAGDALSLTSLRTHCLRICAHVLRHSTSASRGATIRQFHDFGSCLSTDIVLDGDSSDRVKMIMSAFSAFTSVGATIDSSQREDVRGVAIYLYSGTRLAMYRD
jgi:HEAT repeat-containing protein 5